MDIDIRWRNLNSFKHAQEHVLQYFNIDIFKDDLTNVTINLAYNNISSFIDCPQIVYNLNIRDNPIMTFEGCPHTACSYTTPVGTNKINGGPLNVMHYFLGIGDYSNLKDIRGISKYTKTCEKIILSNQIEYGGIELLLLKSLNEVVIRDYNDENNSLYRAAYILNTYIQNKKSPTCTDREILQCKIELEKAGLHNFALFDQK